MYSVCFGGREIVHARNASFPHSGDRNYAVDGNNVLTFQRSSGHGNYNDLNVIFRMPISGNICHGACVGSMNITISTIGLGLFFGITDGLKSVLAQASYPNGNFQLLYGIDKVSYISPNYIGISTFNYFLN